MSKRKRLGARFTITQPSDKVTHLLKMKPRLVAISILAIGLLIATVAATGGGFPTTTAPVATTGSTPMPEPTPTVLKGRVRGVVKPTVRRLTDHTWQFLYTVHNLGTVPIAGFQLNGPGSNLFHVKGKTGWTYYGSGVCGGAHAGVLIYWSTPTSGPALIAPKGAGRFGFTVNTSGSTRLDYSLSADAATPEFGSVVGPAASSMSTTGPCTQ